MIRQQGLRIGALFLCLSFQLVYAGTGPRQAAIASAHPLATNAGLDILQQGGNAFDAAVTVSAVLAVVEPYSSGLGGGGFWLLHRAEDGHDVMLDGRERAPLKAHAAMYQDAQGNVIPGASMNGALAAGIPGEPAALAHIAEHFGRLPLTVTLAPAISLARDGFPVDKIYQRLARFRLEALRASPAAAKVFLAAGEVPTLGALIKQPDLATTLERLAREGRDGYYAGSTAQALVQAVNRAGGIWTQADLNEYRVIERQPVTGQYHSLRITSATLPSSGGIGLVEMLNLLEPYDLANLSEAQLIHRIVEAMRRAYRDRAAYLGDADYVDVPIDLLLSKAHADRLRASIKSDKATPSVSLEPVQSIPGQGQHTTHFSILDSAGNRVAATLSINYPFGSGFVAAGTGVLLNDEMDDFVAKPGVPNAYGLVGAHANAIQPGKRMLSSMTPTFLEDEERIAILGTPGGSRIISMVMLATLAFDAGATAEEIVAMPRFHHQYLPDAIQFEPGAFSPAVQAQLQRLGHHLNPLNRAYGNMQAIVLHKHQRSIEAASDPRGIGAAMLRSVK